MAHVRDFPVSLIKVDPSTQPRTKLDEEAVERYLEALNAGVELPPVVTFFDGEHDWLADGYIRLAAHKRAGRETIKAERHTGTLVDAQWYSYGANKAHGLPLTKEDKAHAIRAALVHPKSKDLADGALAAHLGVHQTTVSKYRRESSTQDNLELEEQGDGTSKRIGLDGKARDTTNIGRRATGNGSLPEPDGDASPPDSDEQPTEADAQEHDAFWDDPPSELARPADEPTAPPPTVRLLDGVGGEVPERLWPIFQAKEQFDAACNAVSQAKKLVNDLADGKASAYLRRDLVSADLDNARSQVKNSAPYAVCPYCEAKEGKKCDACHGVGWVTKLIYDQAPDRKRSAGRKQKAGK